jgi:D-alanyl-lipoteichoic acid acyltransferase DltB (MBOAT superfamily)
MFFVPKYILILLIAIVIDYTAALFMDKVNAKQRKILLVVSVVSTCLVLVVFKYLGFFHNNMIALSHYFGFSYPDRVINIILPIGLSFHTFQSLCYVIEVYRGNYKAEKHFGIYSAYVMFYPQLVTGPIERPHNLLRQIREVKTFQLDNVIRGLRLILFGFFIKMVIADNLAVYVDQIYENPAIYNSWSILTGLLFYSFQIYCDFFGYSTIALGCALQWVTISPTILKRLI